MSHLVSFQDQYTPVFDVVLSPPLEQAGTNVDTADEGAPSCDRFGAPPFLNGDRSVSTVVWDMRNISSPLRWNIYRPGGRDGIRAHVTSTVWPAGEPSSEVRK